MERNELADANSTLGMLQRGRGSGYLRCLELSRQEAAELLTHCITNDPRWDSQVEDRDDYYASLALAIEMDLAPLAQHLRLNDDKDQFGNVTGLTVTTLGAMARRGDRRAVTVLTDYMSFGQWWDWPLDGLFASGIADYAAIAANIAEHFPEDSDLREALPAFWLNEEPWITLANVEDRIARAVTELRALGRVGGAEPEPWWRQIQPAAKSEADLGDLTVADLLQHAQVHSYRRVARLIEQRVSASDEQLLLDNLSASNERLVAVCIRGLGRIGTPMALQAITAFVVSRPETKGILLREASGAIAAFPPAFVLGLGREWFSSPRWELRRIAEEVLKQHATLDDLPVLRSTVISASSDDDMHRLCSVLEAFPRFSGLELPEVETVFTEVQYSYARPRAAKALLAASPGRFVERFAAECLWDCEPGVRVIGCQTVPVDVTATKARLAQMAGDPYEEDHVKEEATSRLTR